MATPAARAEPWPPEALDAQPRTVVHFRSILLLREPPGARRPPSPEGRRLRPRPGRQVGRPPETPGFLCVCQAASGSFCRAWIFRRSSAVMIRQARSARRRRFKRSIG